MMNFGDSSRLGTRVASHAAIIAAFAALVSTLAHADRVEKRTLVVVLIDGVSASLLETAETPMFDRLRREGVWSDSLVPVFPSLSHTNWVSLSTGCWPMRHGIVSNAFEVEGVPVDFETLIDADTLLGCQTLQEVAEAQGVRTAALGWTGARSATRGDLASVVKPYFDSWGPEWDVERARQVVEQLERDDPDRPRLVLAYFNGPDTTQHQTGVSSKATRAAIERADSALGLILETMVAMSTRERVTLLVVTDHGMMMADRLLNLAKILRRAKIDARFVADGPLAFVYLDHPDQKQEAARRLSGDEKFEVVLPESQPSHWRLGTSRRVGDLMLYARAPYFFPMDGDLPSWLPSYARYWPENMRMPHFVRRIGMHGYAVEDQPEMRGIFFAWGNGIAQPKALASPVRAIDLHSTVAHLLEIRPGVPQDGKVLEDVLE